MTARSRSPAAPGPASSRSHSTSPPPRPPIPASGRTFRSNSSWRPPARWQAPLSAKAEVRLNGAVVMVNGVSGTLGDGAFNGWASADLSSKPLVKLDLDFQRLDIAVFRERRRPIATRPAASMEQRHDRPDRVELCRRAGPHLRRRDQHRRGAFRAGRDRRRAGRRRLKVRFANLGAYGGQANGDLIVDASLPEPDLFAAQRSRRRARAAAAAKCGRFRQARRQTAGEARAAFDRQQPARHHVQPRRHRVRGVPGRRDPRPQRRADDPLAHLGHAVGLAGGQGADHGPDAARRLVPRREGPGHDQRPQSGRPAGEDDRRRHRRSRRRRRWRFGSSRNWC